MKKMSVLTIFYFFIQILVNGILPYLKTDFSHKLQELKNQEIRKVEPEINFQNDFDTQGSDIFEIMFLEIVDLLYILGILIIFRSKIWVPHF